MVIRRIGNLNFQLVKDNFATRKHNIYELNFSIKFSIKFLNFQLEKHNLQLVKLFS